MRVVPLAWIGLAVLAGCSGGGGSPGAPDAGPPGPDAQPVPDGGLDHGTLSITEERAEYGSSGRAFGLFSASGFPFYHTKTMEEGGCALYEFEQAFCEDPCDGVCTAPDVCEPFPTWDGVGTIQVTGLRVPLTMQPDGGDVYNPPDLLPEDLFADDATIVATASGGVVPGFTAQASGVAPLASDTIPPDHAVAIPNGADFTFVWDPAPGDARVRLTWNSQNAAHGAPYFAIMRCEAPDSAGSLTIPRAMIEAFPETMAWEGCVLVDCPPSRLSRVSSDRVELAGGHVLLTVSSEVVFGIDHPAAP